MTSLTLTTNVQYEVILSGSLNHRTRAASLNERSVFRLTKKGWLWAAMVGCSEGAGERFLWPWSSTGDTSEAVGFSRYPWENMASEDGTLSPHALYSLSWQSTCCEFIQIAPLAVSHFLWRYTFSYLRRRCTIAILCSGKRTIVFYIAVLSIGEIVSCSLFSKSLYMNKELFTGSHDSTRSRRDLLLSFDHIPSYIIGRIGSSWSRRERCSTASSSFDYKPWADLHIPTFLLKYSVTITHY